MPLQTESSTTVSREQMMRLTEIVRPCAGGFHCGRVAGPPVALKTCK